MRSAGDMEAQATAILKSWLPKEAKIERLRADAGADFAVRNGSTTLVVEAKRLADPGWIRAAVDQIRGAAHHVGRNAVPVIAVPFMAEGGRRVCQEAQVSWFDLCGNADISAPGLRVYVEGKANIFKRPGRPSTVFAPRSSRIVRRFLIEPKRAFHQRELARATGLDEGFTSRIVKKLEADRMLRRTEEGSLALIDPDLLLDSWRDAYDFSKHHIVAGHIAARSGEETLARLADVFRKKKFAHAATGLSGAWLLNQFAMFRLVTFFVAEQPSQELMKAAGFRAEERGANVWLVVPNDEGVFAEAREQNGVQCVHPVQAFLDLKGHPERAQEAATELRKQLLNWGN